MRQIVSTLKRRYLGANKYFLLILCLQVTTPILKLFAELVQNRSQRLQFDVSSPNGILLFREASKIICSYGNRILDVHVTKEQMYPLKLKGISICFSMLKAALCGSYVNFGVFRYDV